MQRSINKWVWAETFWTPEINPTDWAHPFWLALCFQVIFNRYLLILVGVKHSCSLDRSDLALCHSIRPEACTYVSTHMFSLRWVRLKHVYYSKS